MFGLSKIFVIFIIISLIISYGLRDYRIGLNIMLGFIIVTIIWRIATQ